MYIKNIELKDFRNYESLNLQFNKNVNLILGKNAQGKTNLLEAIYVTSIGKSFRTNKDSDLIRFGSEFAKVYIEVVKDDMDSNVEIIYTKEQKKYAKIDGVKLKRTSELLKNVFIVIFSPEDLKIVKDEPEKRRKFTDRELCQIKPAYYDSLSNYKKILIQRNSYLKEFEIDRSMLDVWDAQLARYGAVVMNLRNEFINNLSCTSAEIHKKITNGKENLEIKYKPNIDFYNERKKQEEAFYEILKKSYDADIRQRTTNKGPHKDDFELYIDGINVRNFGSQGQQRTAALSLKLAEIEIIKNETGYAPVLLLDDVMSELDLERQEYLVKTLSDVQLFITTTEIPKSLTKKFPDFTSYNIEKGKISIF